MEQPSGVDQNGLRESQRVSLVERQWQGRLEPRLTKTGRGRMHQSAKDQIGDHFSVFEGVVPYMYLDVRGLVTVGIGNLLDPLSTYGKKVRFYRLSDRGYATDAEVKADFATVKSKVVPGGNAPQPGWDKYWKFEALTKLRVYPDDLKAAVLAAVAAQESWVRGQIGSVYDELPADVQVVLVQMGYAGGLKARMPQLAPLIKAGDYLGARRYAYLTNQFGSTRGYEDYNAAFRMMLMNAWILDQCSELDMTYQNPDDITQFYGVRNGLQVARWFTSNDVSLELQTDDVVTIRDYSAWIKSRKYK